MRGPWLGQVKLAPGYRELPFISGRRPHLGDAPTLTDANYSQVLSLPKAIVDFWSPGCPYCVQFKPIFEAMAANPPAGAKMFTADVDQAGQSFAQYNPKVMPTVIFLQNGKEVHRAEGGMSADDFAAEVSQAFGGNVPAPKVPAGVAPAPGQPTYGPTTVTTGSSGGGSIWLGLGGLAAAGVMGWLLLKQ